MKETLEHLVWNPELHSNSSLDPEDLADVNEDIDLYNFFPVGHPNKVMLGEYLALSFGGSMKPLFKGVDLGVIPKDELSSLDHKRMTELAGLVKEIRKQVEMQH